MTFREKSTNKLYAFALAAVFALTLAGCGGGGGGSAATTPPDETPMPSPQETCEAGGGRYNADGSCTSAADLAEEMALSGAQEAAMAAYMAAMAAVGGAKDPVAAAKAQMYAAMAMEASDAAAMATTSAMAMEYQMKAEMNRDMAMEAAGDRGLGLTMLANKQLNSEDIANAELEGDDDPPAYRSNASNVGMAMENAANAAAAAATLPATPAEGAAASIVNDTTDGNSNMGSSITNLGASSATDATAVSAVTITATTAVVAHKAGGSTFTLEFGAGNAFTAGETPSRFQTRGGWEAQDLVYQQGAGTATAANTKTHLVVSTDIQAPTQSYAETATRDSADATTTPVVGGVIVAGEVAGDGSNFAATFNAVPADNMPPVTGQFQCNTDAACSISVDEDGAVVASTGYSFHPSTGITNPDGDYLAWGFWVTGSIVDTLAATTPNANTAPDAQAGAFAYGSQVFTVQATHKGTASYNGVANGLYSAGGMVEYFDADASLTANFGGGAESTADGATLAAVTGSITNIRAAGMDVAGSLTLGRATITEATANTGSSAGFSDDVSGTLAGRAMEGRWYGQFYGSGAHPTTAAGTFAAEAPGHSNDPVRIMGAFGAWKAE